MTFVRISLDFGYPDPFYEPDPDPGGRNETGGPETLNLTKVPKGSIMTKPLIVTPMELVGEPRIRVAALNHFLRKREKYINKYLYLYSFGYTK